MSSMMPWIVATLGGSILYCLLLSLDRILRLWGKDRLLRIADLISPEMIVPELRSATEIGALEELAALLADRYEGVDRDEVFHALHESGRRGPKFIDDGVVVPRGRLPSLDRLLACCGRSISGIRLGSSDGPQAHLFFVIISPADAAGFQSELLARLGRIFQAPSLRLRLMEARSAGEMHRILAEQEDPL